MLLKNLKLYSCREPKRYRIKNRRKNSIVDIQGTIHASSDTVEAEGRQMKQRSIKYLNFVCTFRHYTITYKLPYIYKATVNMYTYNMQLNKKIILIQLLIII
jgi:hypothetical protein